MSVIRYIGDMHLGHANAIKFDGRPFSSADEMDKIMIEYYNSVVSDGDDVYIVGDFCYRNNTNPADYLKKLKGKKHLVIGNHDSKLIKNSEAMKYFVDSSLLYDLVDNGRRVVVSHYPFAEWNGMFRESYHVYGHIHNNRNSTYRIMKERPRALNSGCMINNYMPCTLDEMIVNNKLFFENESL